MALYVWIGDRLVQDEKRRLADWRFADRQLVGGTQLS